MFEIKIFIGAIEIFAIKLGCPFKFGIFDIENPEFKRTTQLDRENLDRTNENLDLKHKDEGLTTADLAAGGKSVVSPKGPQSVPADRNADREMAAARETTTRDLSA